MHPLTDRKRLKTIPVCAGLGWRCWLQFNQREDLHPGHRTLPDPEGAVRPQRQSDGSVLCWGSLRPERSRETWWKSGHLEGRIKWTHLLFHSPEQQVYTNYLDGNMKEPQTIFWRVLLNPKYIILLNFNSFYGVVIDYFMFYKKF